jgi:hypothetical protein
MLQNPKKVKTECNVAESSKEGSKRAVLPMMIMMMISRSTYIVKRIRTCGTLLNILNMSFFRERKGSPYILNLNFKSNFKLCVKSHGFLALE